MTKRNKNWFFDNIANGITVLGLVLSVWLLIIALAAPERLWLITFLAAIIGLSDFIDGKIANYLKTRSFLGSALDRLRDKIFICPTLIILATPYWKETFHSFILAAFTTAMVVIIALVEFLLLVFWFFGVVKKLDVAANQYGRVKMMLEFGVVMIWLISLAANQSFGLPIVKFSVYLINLLLFVTIYYAIKSLEGYYQRYSQQTTNSKQ